MAVRGPGNGDHVMAVVAGLVALVAIVGATMVALEWTKSPNTEKLVVMLVGLAGTNVVTQVVNLARTERGNRTLEELRGTLNGELDRRIAQIVQREVPDVVQPIVEAAVRNALRRERRVRRAGDGNADN